MKTSSYILKQYPWYFKFLPISDHAFTSFLNTTIYFSKGMYLELKNKNPSPLTEAVLLHQLVHIQNHGLKKFLKFVLFKKYRIEEETKAYKIMFTHLKKHNQTFDLEFVAKNFSGIRYLWMLNYAEALQLAQKLWDES